MHQQTSDAQARSLAANEVLGELRAQVIQATGISDFGLRRRLAWPVSSCYLSSRFGVLEPSGLSLPIEAGREDPLRFAFGHLKMPWSYYSEPSIKFANSADPKRAEFVQDLRDYEWPLFSLDDLCEVMRSFISHLEDNRAHLVATGFPRSVFRASKWFHQHLGTLAVSKVPMYVLSHANCVGEDEYSYVWPSRPATSVPGIADTGSLSYLGVGAGFWYDKDFKAYTNDGSLVTGVPYDDAPLLQGLSPADGALLPGIRGRLLDMEIEFLDCLHAAVSAREMPFGAREAVAVLDNAEDLLTVQTERIESVYREQLGIGYRTPSYVLVRGQVIGNLVSLLMHCAAEMVVGRLDQTRQLLDGLVGWMEPGIPACCLTSYDDIIGKPEQSLVDAAYEVFMRLGPDEREEWRDFYRPQEPERLYVKCSGQMVAVEHYAKLSRYVENQAKFAVASLELTGELPVIQTTQVIRQSGAVALIDPEVLPTPPEEPVFDHSEDYRIVKLRGVELKPLSLMQADIVRILHEAFKNRKPTLTQAAILEKMSNSPMRLSDVFRGNDPRKVLIERVGKDTYRLKF